MALKYVALYGFDLYFLLETCLLTSNNYHFADCNLYSFFVSFWQLMVALNISSVLSSPPIEAFNDMAD